MLMRGRCRRGRHYWRVIIPKENNDLLKIKGEFLKIMFCVSEEYKQYVVYKSKGGSGEIIVYKNDVCFI